MNRGPTLHLLLDLCARLRMACEAIGNDGDPRILPTDIRPEDLSAPHRLRLEQEAQRDLWAFINQNNAAPVKRAPRKKGAA